jgi:uncharacterized protein
MRIGSRRSWTGKSWAGSRRRYQGHIVLLLTQVAEARRERGISSALIAGVLDLVRAAQATVAPRCKVTAGYVLRHPELQDSVPEQYRSLLQPISRPDLRPQR